MSRTSSKLVAAAAVIAMVAVSTQTFANPLHAGGGSHFRAGPGMSHGMRHGMRHGHGFRHGGHAGLAIGLGLLAIGAIAAAAQAAPQAPPQPEQVGPCYRSNLAHYHQQRDNARRYFIRWSAEIQPDNPGYASSLAQYRDWFNKANRCIVALEGAAASQALPAGRLRLM